MRRIDALRVLAEQTTELPVVVTCAASSRELAAISTSGDGGVGRANHLYLLDSMGLAGSVATGIALGLADTPVPKVIAIEGDGSLLMNPNVLPTGGFLRPEKLVMVLLDNAVYGATANLPTYSEEIDLGLLAEASGWAVHRAADPEELSAALALAVELPGPALVHVHVEVGNATNVPKLLEDPVIIGRRFQQWLRVRVESPAEVAL